MSLTLLQGYSSSEQEQEQESDLHFDESSSADEDDLQNLSSSSSSVNLSIRDKSLFELPQPSSHPSLPSAFDAFSEVSGPPEFLNNSVDEYSVSKDVDQPRVTHGGRRHRKDKKDLPTGAVLEAKAQLVGIHERVRSDIESNQPSNSSISNTTQEGKRLATATNPNAEDAAELLRMCLHCDIPKTFSNARGMFCPLCGDRPPDPTQPSLDGSAEDRVSEPSVDNEPPPQSSEVSTVSSDQNLEQETSPSLDSQSTKRSSLTARERLKAARVLNRYTYSKPSKSDMGSKVLEALRESDRGKKKSRLPEAPTNLFDDSKRGMPKQGLTFDFPGGSDLFIIIFSFVFISTVMFATTYIVWKVGAIHFNEY